jgi:hypothetical protein
MCPIMGLFVLALKKVIFFFCIFKNDCYGNLIKFVMYTITWIWF